MIHIETFVLTITKGLMKYLTLVILTILTSLPTLAEEFRLGVEYSQGSSDHFGDISGHLPASGLLGLQGEFLDLNFSSTYNFLYLVSSRQYEQHLWLLEKGYFWYPFGATNTLRKTIDLRIGLNAGIGRYDLSDASLSGIYYQNASSLVFGYGAEADFLLKLSENGTLLFGCKYKRVDGIQGVTWTFITLQGTLGYLFHF